MDNKIVADEWFNYAERDLESAKFLLKMYPVPIEIICYHCEQSAEKYLKGWLIFKGMRADKTHDLGLLNRKCVAIDSDFKTIEDECLELVPYGVHVRYPYELDVIEEDMNTAIICAQEIQKFVMSKVM
ncbi:HEPN domain-containing protein [Clostridium sp. SM-530-WT-3G]|uniref:HEPN domain-containing protein n=1 Tax=Clostridium sp. SM-530-WT-3G TaxID=2725303 RepID=UPI000EB9B8E8|nr:HEPN domain-containing protein [Clostridium sp. SM-530-WT-3G]NME83774.1 HEPN domain-containing protein [Clostridium sp. SM-530-WT-3G]HCW52934.1 DNA-binding protein [Clostridium sp.]